MNAKARKGIKLSVYIVLGAVIILLTAFDLFKIPLLSDAKASAMLAGTLQRLAASVIVVIFVVKLKFTRYIMSRPTLISIVLILPALAIAVNNFPIIDFFRGNLTLTSTHLLTLFVAECLSVGMFEEIIFRGFLFVVMLEKCETKKGILLSVVISSAAFGLLHLVNLLAGSGFGATIMQIGYSFLIGTMMCFVLLVTNNIFACVLLHATYNFCGLLFPTLGLGNAWSYATIMLTGIVSVVAITIMLTVFFSKKFQPESKLKLLLKE